MNKLMLKWVFMAVSYGLIVFWPCMFIVKGLTEPAGWFFYSSYMPWLMFIALEVLSIFSFFFNKKALEKLWSEKISEL